MPTLNYSQEYRRYTLRSIAKLAIKPFTWRKQVQRIRQNQELLRVTKLDRQEIGSTQIFGFPFQFNDSLSLIWNYNDIFLKEIYAFKAKRSDPVILDVGANIGLSVLYFKQRYPQAKIIAFEPDREIFKILATNVQRSGHTDVELVQKAVWNQRTYLTFSAHGADAGRIEEGIEAAVATQTAPTYQVETTRLREYLAQPIDLLKIDIEGAEVTVLNDCADCLGNVDQIFVEYHSFADQPQQLHQLIQVLSAAGFRLHIQPGGNPAPQPFLDRPVDLGMDMQLNIFAVRD